ncbi:MAG: cytochrome c [Rhodobacteraceae bacterium]|nr:cytochrome c [Paracoccaceae bacterium]
MRPSRPAAALSPVLALAGLLGAAMPAAAQDAAAGQALFLAQCAYCHGEGARGDGPRAAVLNPPPADLTRLAAGNGGVFPVRRVIFRIDGRDPLAAHGSPMPVFGEFFEGQEAVVKSESGQPVLTSKPVADILAWLATIQR